MIVNAALALSGILLFVAFFWSWLEGPKVGGGVALLCGSGFLAEAMVRRAGWLPEADPSKSLGMPWLIALGASMMIGGVLTLLDY
jgi:predicted phage tail protein